MDVCKSERASKKQTAVAKPRVPLAPAEKNNAVTTTLRSRTGEVSARYKSPGPEVRSRYKSPGPEVRSRYKSPGPEVRSRYKSPTPSTPTGQRRCPSPSPSQRTTSAASQLVSKRAQSAERKRPATPSSPLRPSTPLRDSSVDMHVSSRRPTNGRLPESLWPSTMRSLNSSFQSDNTSLQVSKKEKLVSNVHSDRTLRSNSNVAHKQAETPTLAGKPTRERKRSPLKGKNVPDQSENSRPVDSLHTRLIDQHRWPSRTGGKVSSSALNKTVDLADKTVRTAATSVLGTGPSLRRLSLDGIGKPLQKSSGDTVELVSLDEGDRLGFDVKSVDDNSSWDSGIHKLLSKISTERTTLPNPVVRSQLLSTSQTSRPSSPNKTSHPSSPNKTLRPSSPIKTLRPPSPIRTSVSSTVSRGISPSRARPSTPPSRGVSPSRTRTSNPPSQSNSSTSVLNFISDFRKGKKGASHVEDAHQLRLLHNRYLQWRFANARAEAVLYIHKAAAERTLYNVWSTTLALWDSIARKRIDLQQLTLELKLNSILSAQMLCLNDWSFLEREHISSLSGAEKDLEASTLRVPVAGGARADVGALKAAVCSAVDVMQTMGTSICSLLSRVEAMNCLVSELAATASWERAMVDECENLLASTVSMQVEEYSLRTHLVQMKQDFKKEEQPIIAIKTSP